MDRRRLIGNELDLYMFLESGRGNHTQALPHQVLDRCAKPVATSHVCAEVIGRSPMTNLVGSS